MFWGLFITIAFATCFWSWRRVLGGVLFGALAFFFLTGQSWKHLLGYFFGSVCALLSLFRFTNRFTHIDTTPLQRQTPLSGLVVDQRSEDTRVVSLFGETMLVRSDLHLRPGDQIMFSPLVTQASLPTIRRDLGHVSLFAESFDFPVRLAMKGYLAWGSVSKKNVFITQHDATTLSGIERLKATYAEYLGQVFGMTPTRALFLGMTTGDRSGFSRQTYTTFVKSGLVHLLAVSGSNVVYVSLFLGVVFFWLPFYLRILLLSCGLIVYGMICGADSSVLRAISMGIIGLLATLVGRPVDVGRVLRMVAGGMLLWNPLLLRYDLGFLLSFGAVGGILVVMGWYKQLLKHASSHRYSRLFASRLLPSLGATIGVFPLLILRTGEVSLTSVLLNLFIVPLVPVFLVVGAISALIPNFHLVVRVADRLSAHLFQLAERTTAKGVFLQITSLFPRFLFVVFWFGSVWMAYLFLKHLLLTPKEEIGNCISTQDM